jgi:DNA polymerase-3 subunit gamma/tau
MAQTPPASDPAAPAYQVVARRYRPQRFADLVGQEHVARGLAGAIESGRIGHAYLFTGARGVGKTSAARIYAKALECPNRAAGEPCNACDTCRAIAAGQDVDVIEIDAASNRGIDEMRQLRQNVAVRPARGRYKTYIIDEVHMLTREAFNALLKTLEEPPAHVKFVLCTTEPDKLPITILSRCQRFDFQSVDAPAIARRLAQIVEAEGAAATPEALTLIARRAAGSMRDSQSLLEQLLGSATGTVGVDEVHALIGTGREEKVGAIVTALAARDPRAAIAALDEAVAGGADPGGVLEQLLQALRDCLLASVGCGAEMMAQGSGLGVDLAAIGREAGTVTLLAMLQILDHTLARMRSSGHAAVLAEMAMVRLASLEDLDDLAEAVARVSAAGPASAVASAASAVPATRSAAPVAEPTREKKTTHLTPAPAGDPVAEPAAAAARSAVVPHAAAENSPAGAVAAPQSPAPVAAGEPAHASRTAERPREEPLGVWLRTGEAVGGLMADFAAMASRATWRDEVLEVALPASAGQAASFLRRPEVAAKLTRALVDILGFPMRYTLVVEAAIEPAEAAAATPANGRRPGPAASGGGQASLRNSQAALLRETVEHPLVVHVRTLFDAAVRKVEPPRPRPAPLAVASRAAAGGGEQAAGDERDHEADAEGDDAGLTPDAENADA